MCLDSRGIFLFKDTDMKKVKLSVTFRYWIPLSIVMTIVCGLLYLTLQQNIRMSANDPQVQLAEDAASALQNGQSAQAVLPVESI